MAREWTCMDSKAGAVAAGGRAEADEGRLSAAGSIRVPLSPSRPPWQEPKRVHPEIHARFPQISATGAS